MSLDGYLFRNAPPVARSERGQGRYSMVERISIAGRGLGGAHTNAAAGAGALAVATEPGALTSILDNMTLDEWQSIAGAISQVLTGDGFRIHLARWGIEEAKGALSSSVATGLSAPPDLGVGAGGFTEFFVSPIGPDLDILQWGTDAAALSDLEVASSALEQVGDAVDGLDCIAELLDWF